MATTQEAVRRLRIEVTSTGADQATAKLGQLAGQQTAVAATAGNASKATQQFDASMAKSVNQYDAILRQQADVNKLLAANVVTLGNASRAANDNNRSVSESGLEWAEWANHLKVAGEAAYALSPKFRGLVNSLAEPALAVATSAIELAALGVVRGTNLAGKGLVELGVATARASTTLTPFAGQMALTGAAMASWNPTLIGIATTILGKFLPAISALLRIVAPILIIKDTIQVVAEAWDLGGKKLDEYRAIAQKAAAVDLSTSYFQKLTKGAEDAKVPVDALTKALTTLQSSSADQLGGSALQQQLDKHVKAGNFQNNSGVGEFAQANTTEEKYKAITDLIHNAMQDGQRLAAIDIANTAFGPEAADNLRKDSEYFDKINASAAKVSDKQIVSDADVGRALDLQKRYDAAVAILEQRWHPIQDLLTQQGIKMQAAWVGIVEAVATGFDWVTKLVLKINEIPQTFWDYAKNGVHAAAAGVAAVGPALGPAGAAVGAVAGFVADATATDPAKDTSAYAVAVDKLRAGLQNQAEQQRKVNEANTIAQRTIKDTSHTIDDNKKAHEELNDAVDRAINSTTRHIEQQKADAAAVGLGAAALAEFRVQASETAAVQANGGKETDEQAASFARLKDAAGAAADALARAKINNTISRGSQTALLSPEDVTIANQLKDIYPNVATALGSVEASALRTNQAISGVSSQISGDLVTGIADVTDGTKSWGQATVDTSKLIIRAIEEMLVKLYIVAPLMRALQGGFGLLGGGTATATAGVDSLAAIHHGGYGPGDSFATRAVSDGAFRSAPRYHDGIGPGERAAVIRNDESVLTPGQMRQLAPVGYSGGGSAISFGDININLPEGTSAENAQAVGAAVKASLTQLVDDRLAYHSRSRGMLNRAS
jgi:hypothetical protein